MMPEEGGYRLKIQYGFPKRSFKDTFITDECENKLKDSIRSFLKNREWYEKHNIPYHFGIILYGEPGTGKSSVVQAILNEFNFTKIIIPARYLRNGLEQVNESRSDTESTLGIVVEDIDLSRTVTNRDADYDYQKDRDLSSLVELMNSMDGIGCLQNVIYIFTTNNISGIDKALLRPGRLDLHMNISYACDETFDKFLKFHYGKGLPDRIHISDEVIFAQVQTDVMSGLSYEEVIEKYRRKEG